MGVKDSLIRMLGGELPEQKSLPPIGGGANVSYHTVGSSHSRKNTYKEYAEEGYAQNAIVFRCVNEIAQGASSIPFNIKFKGEKLENHELISLLNRPNPLQAYCEYFHALYSYLLISGNSFAYKIKVNQRGVNELHLFRPDRVNVIPSDTFIPKGYEYKVGGNVLATYQADPTNGMSDVKHLKLWSPLNDYYGMSPIYAASADIDLHNLIAKHNVNLMNNGARPTGAVVFNPKDLKSGIPVQLSAEQRAQIVEDLDKRFQGVNNSGKTMLLEGDFDWKEMGLSPKDMDFINAKNMSARDIALCYGVPAQLVGVPDSQTYSNMAEARLALYEETIIPLAKRVQSDLNEWLVPEFGEGLSFEYDFDEIPAIAERRRKIYDNVVQGVREGILTRNEARDRLGLNGVEGGDDVYIQANLFPLGSPKTSAIDEEDAKASVEDDMYSYFMDDYDDQPQEESKATVDTKPTQEMAEVASRALEWRKKYKRGGTDVGVARAVQLKNRENLSRDTIARMHSFFSRHSNNYDKFYTHKENDGGYGSFRIAWDLWGGNSGRSWAARKLKEFDVEKSIDDLVESMAIEGSIEQKAKVSEAIKEALKEKVKDHNEKYKDKPTHKVTSRMLEAVFSRGVGAYHTNPQSVRPSVRSPEQWGLGRVNAFLKAIRSGRFANGKFDTDLMPKGHPLRSKD